MESPFAIVTAALRPNKNWRDSLRSQLGPNGEKLHQILADLAEGKAWMATLPNGQYSAPVLPSSDVRLRAAVFLHEALYGRAVPQTEIQRAELEAKELESVRALNDDQLEAEALRIIESRKVHRLTAPSAVVDAEYAPFEMSDEVDNVEAMGLQIWDAPPETP